MGRWEPNARGRLEQAAMELYLERGFEQTTVADIASRAGLTERTFFRHFTDKREVLFSGSASLQDRLVSAIANAPDTLAPMDAVAVGLEAIAIVLQDRRGREFAQQRQAVIAANAELRERELIKMAALAAATADALRQRGVKEPAASLIAEAGIAVFRVAFERWVRGKKPRDLSRLIQESLSELKLVVAAG